jgi:proteasome lid subunit RPN8/RPN11
LELKTVLPPFEECWPLVGRRNGRIWLARRERHSTGERTRVHFDGAAVLAREEARGDVVGFLHTHPEGPAAPSARDIRTMHAWCGAFGKPLLCLIDGPAGLAGWRFDDDETTGERLECVAVFPRGIVIGVDANA